MFLKKRNKDSIKENHIINFNLLAIFSVIIVILFISFTYKYKGVYNKNYLSDFLNKDKIILPEDKKNNSKSYNKEAFKNINIIGKAYIVYDIKNQIIITSKNENEILPLASLTKIVSAITMIHMSSEDKEIIIKKSLLSKGENLDIGLVEKQKWKMGELLKFALVYSSNPAMDIIAKTITGENSYNTFVIEMNDYVKKLGFKNFIFTNPSGLDYGEVIGGKGTALEYAKLFAKSYELIPEILTYTTNSKINLQTERARIFSIPNTNKDASESVGLLASKTGYTEAAGGNLAVLYDLGLNRKIIIVVLGSTINGRFTDVDALYNATKNSLVNN